MNNLKIVVYGMGVLGIGIASIIWWIIVNISCIMIAGYISTKIFGLNGYYWWFASIITFCILSKIIFLGSSNDFYSKLSDNYKEYVENENKKNELIYGMD